MNDLKPLTDYIEIYEKVIPKNVCDYFINEFDSNIWGKHTWASYKDVAESNSDKELYVSRLEPLSQLKLQPYVKSCIDNYAEKNNIVINGICKPRANKYIPGTLMQKHFDHIYTIFDGIARGIPVLSIVCLLNDDFEGGNFVFFDDLKMNLKQGDILVFPSVFLFPHKVEEITAGTRYSIVQWAY